MPSLERLFRVVGTGGAAAGLLLVGYGYLAAGGDPVTLLAGTFVGFVGVVVLAVGLLLSRLDAADGRV
jgi:CHASE2 domain-containing sensor protein